MPPNRRLFYFIMTSDSSQNTLLGVIITATGVIMFSSKAVIIKLAYQYDIDAVSLLLLRMLFSLPFYILIWGVKRKQWKQNPLSSKHLVSILLLGFLGYYLASFLDFKGLTYITASLERLILFSYPTVVLILSALFLKKKITGKQILSILITYLGIAVIFFDSGGITTGSRTDVITGSIFIALSAIAYASYLVGTNSIIGKVGTVRITTFSMMVSCLVVIIHYMLTTDSDLLNYPIEVYLLSLLMAVIATVIPSFLINNGIRRLGAPNVSIIGSLGPVSTITLSMIFLGESLTFIQVIGALVIISGVVVISRTKAK